MTPSATAFPANIVDALANYFETFDGIESVILRPLAPTDPDASLAVYAVDWQPVTHDIGLADPSIARYAIQLQYLQKHTSQEVGRSLHSQMSKSIRVMLYRDPDLRVGLARLNETLLGNIERVGRWGVSRQRFFTNEALGEFQFISVIDFWVETETA